MRLFCCVGGVSAVGPPPYRLASQEEYPRKKEVIPLKREFMDRVNRVAKSPGAGITIVDFFEQVYVPAITGKLARSTVKGYQDSWRCHIRERIRGRVRSLAS